MTVRIFDSYCECCGSEKDVTPEQIAYEKAVEALIEAAQAVSRTPPQVERDLHDWWYQHRIKRTATLDPNVVRLWWIDPKVRTKVS